jgi:hypothetical protein
MRRIVSFLVLLAILLPVAAPASALPSSSWRRAEAPGLSPTRLAMSGLRHLVQRDVLRLAGAQPRYEVRQAVLPTTLSTSPPRTLERQPVLLAAQRLMDLTVRSLAQVRGAPSGPAIALAA